MELTNFPSEVLAEIFSLEGSSNAVIQLWKCGSRLLQAKLALAVESLDLKDRNVHSSSRYPKCISSLKKLRVLKLDRGTWPIMSSGPQLSSELRSLKLDRLETLHIIGAEFIFLISALEHLNSANAEANTVETMYERGESTLWNLNTSFANLTSLKLNVGDSAILIPSHLFPGLPSTLTHLAIPSYRINNDIEPFMSLLPRNLLHLETTLQVAIFGYSPTRTPKLVPWQNPPPRLHTISRLVLMGDGTTPTFAFLPRSLTSMETNLDWTPSLIATLPPAFAILRLESTLILPQEPTRLDITEFLPSQLRSLTLNSRALQSLCTSPHFFPSLPKTLTELICDSDYDGYLWPVKAVDLTTNDFWPPGLTSMVLIAFNLTSEDLDTMPTTLKLLHTTWNASSPLDFSKLPRILSDFDVYVGNSNEDVEHLTLIPGLPGSLTRLVIEARDQTMDSKFLDLLPSSLLILEIHCCDGRWFTESSLKWPPNLTQLCVDDCTSFSEFSSLPSSMKHLWLFFSSFEPQCGEDHFKDLPVSLETFKVTWMNEYSEMEKPSSTPWSGTSFSNLVNLREICMVSCFEPSILKTLSEKVPKLQSLDVSEIPFSEEYAPLMPQRLRNLTFRILSDLDTENWAPYWPVAASGIVYGIFSSASDKSLELMKARRKKAKHEARTYPAAQSPTAALTVMQ